MGKVQIQPRILKGFRDHLPQMALPRQYLIRKLEKVFMSFGFVPIDTPAIEYAEIILGKGSEETDKQLYRFTDNGKRDVALRFDLTVPLARFVAMHINQLGTPFKRYHIAPVWRAEKPQRGRYREFIQCDFDIIGTTSEYADAEIISIINSALNELGVNHLIRINNRNILNSFLDALGAKHQSTAILRAIDKLEKLGRENVAEELKVEAKLNKQQIAEVFSFLSISSESSDNQTILNELRKFLTKCDSSCETVNQLETLIQILNSLQVMNDSCVIDLSIARGLDYYTGCVFETVCTDLPDIGSICSGGRYDNLAGLYTKAELPGVGASIGLDRLLAALEELGQVDNNSVSNQVFVALMDLSPNHRSAAIAQDLRKAGVGAELFCEPKKLGAQLKYANKKGFELAVIAGEHELERNCVSVKNMKTGEQVDDIPLQEMSSRVKQMLILPGHTL